MDKLTTGIEGLDALLIGGFTLTKSKDGLIVLIKGKPGTGKSTLALAIAKSVAEKLAGNKAEFPDYRDWCYFTCEQKKEDILEKSKTFCLGIDESHIFDSSVPADEEFSVDSPHMLSRTTLMWAVNTLYSTFIGGQSGAAADGKHLIVVDGLNLMSAEERLSINMDWLIATLRRRSLFSIIVYEPLDGETLQVDSMADIVIQLKGEEFAGPPPYYLNKLCITKSRFQRCIIGWHQYKIFDQKGVVIFPSIHYYIHKSNFFGQEMGLAKQSWAENPAYAHAKTNNQCGDEAAAAGARANDGSIIRILLKQSISSGSLTVLLGPRKTCKTLLSIDFLHAGSRNGEKGLLISLIDNRETIMHTVLKRQQMRGGNGAAADAGCMADEQSLQLNHLFHFRPGCITSDEFFYYIDTQMKELDPRRVVLWDLSQIDFSYPLMSSDTMFFPAIVDYLKTGNQNRVKDIPAVGAGQAGGRSSVSSLFIGSMQCKLSKAAFTMADNVVLLMRGENEHAGSILAYVDRVEGKPGTHYLWKISLNNTAAGDEPFYESVSDMMAGGGDESSRRLIKKFENAIRVMGNSRA